MKRLSHCCVWSMVALAVPLAIMLTICTSSFAQVGYTVNGRRVSASTYQAYKIVNESLRLMKENRAAEAAKQLRVALKLDPAAGEARGMLGMALARLGKTDEAAEQMRMAILTLRDADNSGEPRIVPARINLAVLYQSAGRTEDALEMYRKVLADYPHTKTAAALQDRVALLEKELKRQHRARVEHKDETVDDTNYYGNVIGQGRKRWPASAMPIHVYVYSGTGLSGFRPEYESILRQSFDEWQAASKGKVQFAFVTNPRDADITCTWIDDPKLLESSAEGGEAEVQSLLESVVKCRMLLSLNDGGSAFPLTPNLVRALCLHEIGHSLGLMGHSTRVGDVLYCSTPLVDKEQHLSSRDVATLNVLYDTDVDTASNWLSVIEHQTHGNALSVVRLAVALLTLLVAGIIGALIAIKKARANKRSKKPRKAT
jgi:hypothetical protein